MRAIPILCLALLLSGCNGSDCVEVESAIGAICLPEAVTANQQAVLDVRESCGALCAEPPSCTAIVLSGAIYLTLRENQCSTTVAACIATQCSENTAPCALPPLGTGDYPVVVSGGPAAVLHVRAEGVSGCHLPLPPIGPDAGTDAGTTVIATTDAGTSDAGAGDAGPSDAGAGDAGPSDAGSDGGS